MLLGRVGDDSKERERETDIQRERGCSGGTRWAGNENTAPCCKLAWAIHFLYISNFKANMTPLYYKATRSNRTTRVARVGSVQVLGSTTGTTPLQGIHFMKIWTAEPKSATEIYGVYRTKKQLLLLCLVYDPGSGASSACWRAPGL